MISLTVANLAESTCSGDCLRNRTASCDGCTGFLALVCITTFCSPAELVPQIGIIRTKDNVLRRDELSHPQSAPHQHSLYRLDSSMETEGSFDHRDSECFLRVLAVHAKALAARSSDVPRRPSDVLARRFARRRAREWLPSPAPRSPSVGYDPVTRTLVVCYKSDGIYHSEGCTQQHFDDLCAAESVGKHLNAHIKGRFDHRKSDHGSTPKPSS